MGIYSDILTPRLNLAFVFRSAAAVQHNPEAMPEVATLGHGHCSHHHLPRPEQFCNVVGNRQQMQFSRKTGQSPQAEAANPPVMLPSSEDRLDDCFSFPIDPSGSFVLEPLPDVSHLRMIRPHLNSAESTRIICAQFAHGTPIAILAAVDLRRAAPAMSSPKHQHFPLRAGELVFRLVVGEPAGMIGSLFALTALRIVQS